MKISDYISQKDSLNPVQYFTFLQNAVKDTMRVFILGKTNNIPILLLVPKNYNSKLKNIMFCAGFHGEEFAPCWSILRFIEEKYDYYKEHNNISFIPVVNPIGFLNFKRENKENLNTNIFIGNKIAKESKIILSKLNIILKLSKTCFVALHEDSDAMYCYSYVFEKNNTKLSNIVIDSLKTYFPVIEDKKVDGIKDINGNPLIVKKGIIKNFKDGSLEHILFDKGIPFTCVSETPGKSNIDLRIEGSINVIENILTFFTNAKGHF